MQKNSLPSPLFMPEQSVYNAREDRNLRPSRCTGTNLSLPTRSGIEVKVLSDSPRAGSLTVRAPSNRGMIGSNPSPPTIVDYMAR